MSILSTRKNILITGGTGSLGSALVRKWCKFHNVTIFSRDWLKQERLANECPEARFILGDICDYGLVKEACLGQDILIHAAALKHVGIGEANPGEYVRVNVQGTETVARAWQETMSRPHPKTRMHPMEPRKALLINSDKSCSPVNAYGAGKLLAESIFRSCGYSSLRYGNVIDSAGAFIQVWQNRIFEGLPVKVRRSHPTRFALTLEQAVGLVEDALNQEPGIYAPHSLPSFAVEDVARAMGATVEYEPLQPGEKIHEILINEIEVGIEVSPLLARVEHFSIDAKPMGREKFHSVVAPRLAGEEVLAWLHL